jgi:hypothetical protein
LRTLILLGDVYFSESAVRVVVSSDGFVHFFGRRGRNRFTGRCHGEMFGLGFAAAAAPLIVRAAELALHYTVLGEWGNLWDTYHCLLNFPIRSRQTDSNVFRELDDITDDVDTPHDHYLLLHMTK